MERPVKHRKNPYKQEAGCLSTVPVAGKVNLVVDRSSIDGPTPDAQEKESD